jgi:hypothetical protein
VEKLTTGKLVFEATVGANEDLLTGLFKNRPPLPSNPLLHLRSAHTRVGKISFPRTSNLTRKPGRCIRKTLGAEASVPAEKSSVLASQPAAVPGTVHTAMSTTTARPAATPRTKLLLFCLTRIAHPVNIAVRLFRVCDLRAVISFIEDTVAIGVRVWLANVAHAIQIAVLLVGVRNFKAVVAAVGYAITIGVRSLGLGEKDERWRFDFANRQVRCYFTLT